MDLRVKEPAAAVRAARQFDRGVSAESLSVLGQGLINDTFLVRGESFRFVLQRINQAVFPDPAAIMANLKVLNAHVLRQARSTNDCRLPELIPTLLGDDLYRDVEGECWRAISFIENTRNLVVLESPDQASEVGRALGCFHRWVHDLPVGCMQDTLPGFHVTPRYLARLDQVLDEHSSPERTADLDEALAFVARHRGKAPVLEEALRQGWLKPRVIHGDPKLDNVLFDRQGTRAVSLIDLDTVKPGLLQYDLGDCLRSCCNTARLGSTAPEGFDLTLFSAIMQGYLNEAQDVLTPADQEYLHDAVWLLPFELGLRFLTDHLQGDVYFKVEQPGDNLVRALAQFRLARSIELQEGEIRKTMADLF